MVVVSSEAQLAQAFRAWSCVLDKRIDPTYSWQVKPCPPLTKILTKSNTC